MDNSIFNRYAIALLELSIEESSTLRYYDEILMLKKIFKENNELSKILSSKIILKSEIYSIVDKLFSEFDRNIINFIKVIIDNNRGYYLYPILKETLYRFDDYLSVEEGTIYSTIPLSKEKINEIEKVLSKKIKKKVVLENKIDNSLIGGIRIDLKNNVYDASIKNKLESMNNLLKKE